MRPKQPVNSGDLSPIENVWRILKQRVKIRKARNEDELQQYIVEEWERITINEINKLIKTMPNRIDQVIEREGDVTEY
jgi:transposase